MPSFVNPPAPNTPYFTPAQYPAAGTAVGDDEGKDIPKLFQPLKVRGVEFQNRIWYSAQNGSPTDWHMAHLGGIISRGPGLAFVEATAIVPEGRITPEDTGIWSDEHIEPWKRIVQFAHSQNQKIGIQLAHAGRKASTVAPWLSFGASAGELEHGWPDQVRGPSAIAFSDTMATPNPLTVEEIKGVVRAFADAAKRSLKAGFDVVEVHAAHGYLLHQFLSPATNHRTDEYGGSFENRIRLTLEVTSAVRAVIPPYMPLFLRVSASDWLEESLSDTPSWRIEETVKLAEILIDYGVDVLDVSSGANHRLQKIPFGPAYQVHFAEAVKKKVGDRLIVTAVGTITTGKMAQDILDKGQADAVFIGRSFQKNPGLVWAFAEELDVKLTVAHQMEWPFAGRGVARPTPSKF